MKRWFMKFAGTAVLAMFLAVGGLAGMTGVPVLDAAPAAAQQDGPTGGRVPGNVQGAFSDSEMWRAVRGGIVGEVSIPDQNSAVLVQSQGESFRNFRNGPLKQWSAIGMAAILGLLVLFYLLRGKIRIDAGPSPTGETIERFNGFERAIHWVTASSFIVLAITGLNLMYGRYFLLPAIGPEAFAAITQWGKYAHNYIAFAFMVGIVCMFFMWIRNNIPDMTDVRWIAVGGGLFSKGVHPPAKRFNAGQKLIFWSVVVGGFTLSTSGLMLMFPYEYAAWAKTFGFLNSIGFDMPTTVLPIHEAQLNVIWHGAVGVLMIIIIIGHIYIGSVGMEGAFDAVGSGQVDVNWASEHHGLWVKELRGETPATGHQQPAE